MKLLAKLCVGPLLFFAYFLGLTHYWEHWRLPPVPATPPAPTFIAPPLCIELERVKRDGITNVAYANSHCEISFQTFIGPTLLVFPGGRIGLHINGASFTYYINENPAVSFYRINAWDSQEAADEVEASKAVAR